MLMLLFRFSPLLSRRDSEHYLTQVDRANKQSHIAEKRQAKQQSAGGKRKPAPDADDPDVGEPKSKKQATQPQRENIRTFHQSQSCHDIAQLECQMRRIVSDVLVLSSLSICPGSLIDRKPNKPSQ